MASQIERAASPPAWHILIAGGGTPGLSLALALTQALGSAVRVTVADPAFLQPRQDSRAFAVSPAAMRMLEALGVWAEIRPCAQPILGMTITDSRLDDPIRPDYLRFQGDDQPLGHMVEADALGQVLQRRCRDAGVALAPDRITSFTAADQFITTNTGEGARQEAALLVAADGARSRLRDQAGIAMHGWDYDQVGIVTTVAHERGHEGRAEEHFLPGGPFATLPLTGNRSSIVWTERKADADRIMALPDAEFHLELERRFGLKLGEISVVGRRAAFPLAMRIARNFVAERLALVGDAAHVIHPIAGQGLNLGIRDVAALAECVIDTAELGLDIGAPDVLERYQRWRRFDTVAMGMATDGLNRLFSNDSHPLRFLRDLGLGIVDRLPGAKRLFIREAAGVTGVTPKLMQKADAGGD
jgi:2-octaprenyl-6-methoxyphenol hydroxylase